MLVAGMTEEAMKLMEESLAKASVLVNDPETVWHVRNATELNVTECQNSVEYKAKNAECELMMIAGEIRGRGKFARGVLTTTIGQTPVVLNLPPDFLDLALKKAMISVCSKN
jgi:hypothetical protein